MADFDRRALLKAGLTATAVGTLGLTGVRTAAAAAVPTPTIHGTAEWNARAATGAIVVENHKPTYIVVHHTVDPGNVTDYSLAHALQISRDIQNFHMDTHGWIDTGQQFTNSRGGYITEGQAPQPRNPARRHPARAGRQRRQPQQRGHRHRERRPVQHGRRPQALWDSLVIAGRLHREPVLHHARVHQGPPRLQLDRVLRPGALQPAAGAADGGGPRPRRLGRAVSEAEWPLLKPGATGKQVQLAQQFLRAPRLGRADRRRLRKVHKGRRGGFVGPGRAAPRHVHRGEGGRRDRLPRRGRLAPDRPGRPLHGSLASRPAPAADPQMRQRTGLNGAHRCSQ